MIEFDKKVCTLNATLKPIINSIMTWDTKTSNKPLEGELELRMLHALNNTLTTVTVYASENRCKVFIPIPDVEGISKEVVFHALVSQMLLYGFNEKSHRLNIPEPGVETVIMNFPMPKPESKEETPEASAFEAAGYLVRKLRDYIGDELPEEERQNVSFFLLWSKSQSDMPLFVRRDGEDVYLGAMKPATHRKHQISVFLGIAVMCELTFRKFHLGKFASIGGYSCSDILDAYQLTLS